MSKIQLYAIRVFSAVCDFFNRRGYSFVVAGIRGFFAVILPTEDCFYGKDEDAFAELMGEEAEDYEYEMVSCGGYIGWLDSPVGVLAFRTEEGNLEWRW